MRPVLIRKILLISLLILTCSGCQEKNGLSKKEFLDEFAYECGYGDDYKSLYDWNILNGEENLEEDLSEDFLREIFHRADSGFVLKDKYSLGPEQVYDEISDFKDYLNSREYPFKYEYEFVPDIIEASGTVNDSVLITNDDYQKGDLISVPDGYYVIEEKTENGYLVKEAELEELYDYLEISDSFEADFSNCEDISDSQDDELYENRRYELLSTSYNKSFQKKGYRISYSISASGISIHVSRNVNGINIYGDVSIQKIKPSFKWKMNKGKIEEAYMKVSYDSSEEFGFSKTRYLKNEDALKDLPAKDFLTKIRSLIKTEEQEDAVDIKICTIKTPIANLPFVDLYMDVSLRLYASGKADILISNSRNLGFEIKEGKTRIIKDSDSTISGNIRGTLSPVATVSFSLGKGNLKLMDVKTDAGVKAMVKTTAHLFSQTGEMASVPVDEDYSAVEEYASANPYVQVCGDLSFSWVLNLKLNSDKTLLGKWGLQKNYEILNENDPVFSSLSHIEDGHFVEKCTRQDKPFLDQEEVIYHTDRISLETYHILLKEKESKQIKILGLPEGYSKQDLAYSADQQCILVSDEGIVRGVTAGSGNVIIQTKDGKYSASLNVLVSEG